MPRDTRSPRHESKHASGLWLYGLHAVRAALANPQRHVKRAVLTARATEEIGVKLLGRLRHETADTDAVGRLLPPGAVHQGVALLCEPLPERDLETVLDAFPPGRRLVAVLDQVTDQHNEGAILRSAAAFGVAAIVVQDRHAPPESGALAKAASGALERVALVRTVNLARALGLLKNAGFWCVGLDARAESTLGQTDLTGKIVLVLGAEGEGLRRLTRDSCDFLAKIPMAGGWESLNLASAAAIALYAASRPKPTLRDV